MKRLTITKKTKVNRLPKRAFYDTGTIFKILDEAFICHIGFKVNDETNVIPTVFGRKEDSIFVHASKNSRLVNAINKKDDLCITVTIADGIVLARSAFHHSINYRSVILFSKGVEITEPAAKAKALENILEHIIPGRWGDVRKPSKKELDVTSVLQFKINEASAKIRTGPPIDDKQDLNLKVWAGVIPLETTAKVPIEDRKLEKKIPLPGYIHNYCRSLAKEVKNF